MNGIRIQVSKIKKLIKAYNDGKISEEEISRIEEARKKPIADIIAELEQYLYTREHSLLFMTLPHLRRWAKSRSTLSNEEKFVYATVNGITYEEFEVVALDYLKRWEAIELEKKIRREQREAEKERAYLTSLVEKGEATTKDGMSYCIPISRVFENIYPDK